MSSEEWRGVCFGPNCTSFGWRELRGCVICFVWFLLDGGIIWDQPEHRGLDCGLFFFFLRSFQSECVGGSFNTARFSWKQLHSPPHFSPPSPPRGRVISKALPFLSWWLREDTAPKESVLSGEWSRSFQSSIPALDSYPSWAAVSDVVVLGKRELECPVFITNTVRENIAGHPHIPFAQRPGGGPPGWLEDWKEVALQVTGLGVGFCRRLSVGGGWRATACLCCLLGEPGRFT